MLVRVCVSGGGEREREIERLSKLVRQGGTVHLISDSFVMSGESRLRGGGFLKIPFCLHNVTWAALLLCQNKLAGLQKKPHCIGVNCIMQDL